MSQDTIQVYARVRPSKTPSAGYKCFATSDESRVEFQKPRESADGYINNSRETYDFRFNGVFDMQSRQEEIFEVVARKAVDNALQGYNSTIFAYGQTGSGKTFTITGGPEKYADRGIIPRTLSYIFDFVRKHPERFFNVHISYLEIYNNQGFDLLDPSHETMKLEDLPKVSLLEDMDGNIHLRNLSAHQAAGEEDALNLLFLGDTNRMISETPMNLVSSRSHCIFTVSIESRDHGSDLVRRSKLHLVDLAGSERVYKTGVNGQILNEAKYINASLLFLEQVIIALSERSKGKDVHVPYRNSILTSVLRDSLGGNSKTVMIATLNPDQSHVEESISTCRFALRVASIKQTAQINEEMDPKLLIRRLKQQISELKEELSFVKGEDSDDGPILDADRRRVEEMCRDFVNDPSQDSTLTLGRISWVREAFKIMKRMVLDGGGAKGPGPGRSDQFGAVGPTGSAGGSAPLSPLKKPQSAPGSVESNPIFEDQLKKLQLQIQQRDNEINILVSMLKKKQAAGGAGSGGPRADVGVQASASSAEFERSVNSSNSSSFDGGPSSTVRQSSGSHPLRESQENGIPARSKPPAVSILTDAELLADRNKFFEMFRKSYRKSEVVEENKVLLKTKYEEAQELGKKVNDTRARINHLKAQIEQLRVEQAMQGIVNETSPEEMELLREMESQKQQYKQQFAVLRDLKSEIEGIQRLLDKSKAQIQKDFEQWYMVMLQQQGVSVKKKDGIGIDGPQLPGSSSAPGLPPAAPPHSAVLSRSTSQPGGRQAWTEHTSSTNASTVSSSSSSSSSNRTSVSATSSSGAAAMRTRTGDAETDADIEAFYRARDSLLQRNV